ncbi:MAG: hypothetical protein GY832_06945 [Chloroflexi bacterium]|nr:hypothetical protein [Chloroflexota bacterium]
MTTQSEKFKYVILVLTILVLTVAMLTIGKIKKPHQAPTIPAFKVKVPTIPTSKVDYIILSGGPYRGAENTCMPIHQQERLTQQWQELGLPGSAPTIDFEQSVVVFLCESYRSTPSDLKIKNIIEQEGTILIQFQFNKNIWEEEGIPQCLVIAIHETQMPIEIYRDEYFGWELVASQRITLVLD